MLEPLPQGDWTVLPQPPTNRPGVISAAIRAAAAASTDAEATAAATRLLDALGNNHAGTYYPVVLEVVPFMKAILDQGTDWAKTTVLNVLIDLVCSFEPEAGHETVRLPGGPADLARSLDSAVRDIRSSIDRIAASDGIDAQTRQLAIELAAELDR